MFKVLYLVVFNLLSAQTLAQSFEPAVCNEGQSCIKTTTPGGNQSEHHLINVEDVDGQIVATRLSSKSPINDVFYEGVSACYQGEISDVCDMGELMSGNANLDYAQGGHARIENFNCYAINGVVSFEYDVDSDYDDEPLFTKVEITKCQ